MAIETPVHRTVIARYLFPAFVLQCLSGALVTFLPARLINSSYPLLPWLPNIWLILSLGCGATGLVHIAYYSYQSFKTKEVSYRSEIISNIAIVVVSIASLALILTQALARAG